jgi:hypothetical protein
MNERILITTQAAQQVFAPDNLPLGFSKAMRQPKHLWLGVVLLARLRVKRGVGRPMFN